MGDEYIKREDAKALFCKCCESGSKVKCWLCKKDHPMDAIPAADVRPVVHARWIEKGGVWECPNCKAAYKARLLYIKPNYCPNCGADMRPSEEPESLTYISPEERSGVNDD